jgi:hypothetical protein
VNERKRYGSMILSVSVELLAGQAIVSARCGDIVAASPARTGSALARASPWGSSPLTRIPEIRPKNALAHAARLSSLADVGLELMLEASTEPIAGQWRPDVLQFGVIH